MTDFVVGQRVELVCCTGFGGTVVGFGRGRGRVMVVFDDLASDPAKAFRASSLQKLKESK